MPYRTHIHITHSCMNDQNVYKSLAAENLFETLTGNIVSIFKYSDLILIQNILCKSIKCAVIFFSSSNYFSVNYIYC